MEGEEECDSFELWLDSFLHCFSLRFLHKLHGWYYSIGMVRPVLKFGTWSGVRKERKRRIEREREEQERVPNQNCSVCCAFK